MDQLQKLTDVVLEVGRSVEGLDARITQLEQRQQIWEVMAFVRSATVEDGPLVSVILATRNRRALVPAAVASVLAQSYPRWELIAVVDGSGDDTSELLRSFDDPRIQVVDTPHQGLAAARNCGLARASGDLVAYIDDDNTMHEEWLRSVVWAFSAWPDVDLLYGATLVGDDVTREPSQPRGLPWVRFVPYDSADLRSDNPTDIGSIAHRRLLPEASFDEDLGALEDWDLLLRVREHRTVRSLPAIAGTYTTTAPDRITASTARREAWEQLHAKHGIPLRGGSEA